MTARYRCDGCGHRTQHISRMTEPFVVRCTECGHPQPPLVLADLTSGGAK